MTKSIFQVLCVAILILMTGCKKEEVDTNKCESLLETECPDYDPSIIRGCNPSNDLFVSVTEDFESDQTICTFKIISFEDGFSLTLQSSQNDNCEDAELAFAINKLIFSASTFENNIEELKDEFDNSYYFFDSQIGDGIIVRKNTYVLSVSASAAENCSKSREKLVEIIKDFSNQMI